MQNTSSSPRKRSVRGRGCSSPLLEENKEAKHHIETEYFMQPYMNAFKKVIRKAAVLKSLVILCFLSNEGVLQIYTIIPLVITMGICLYAMPRTFGKRLGRLFIWTDILFIVYFSLLYLLIYMSNSRDNHYMSEEQLKGYLLGIRMCSSAFIGIIFMFYGHCKLILLAIFLIFNLIISPFYNNVFFYSLLMMTISVSVFYLVTKMKHNTIRKLASDYYEKNEQSKIHDVIQDGFVIFEPDGTLLLTNKACLNLFGLTEEPENISDLTSRIVVTHGPQYQSLNFDPKSDSNKSCREIKLTLMELVAEIRQKHLYADHPKADRNQFTFVEGYVETNQKVNMLEIGFKMTVYSNQKSEILVFKDLSHSYENVKLQGLNEFKTRLLQTVTHDLRTPLNSIMMLLREALERHDIVSMVKMDLLKPALDNAHLLTYLVNDIVDLAKFSMGGVSIQSTQVNLQAKMNEIKDLYEMQMRIKGISFDMKSDGKLPDFIHTDPCKLSQILVNLVGNALKFTQNGSVTIMVSPTTHSGVLFSVQDTGIGIDETTLTELCECVYEEDEKSPRGFVHSALRIGFGVKICHLLCKALGSSGIKIKSEYGVGSTFSFELPINDINSPVVSTLAAREFEDESSNSNKMSIERRLIRHPHVDFGSHPILRNDCHCKNILIIDDNNYNLYVLRRLLEKRGCKVIQASDGKQGYDSFVNLVTDGKQCSSSKCHRVSLVFLDIDMPIMNGIQALRVMREFERGNDLEHVPIIIASAYDEAKMLDEATRLGMNQFILKPIAENKIDRVLMEFCP